MLSEKLLNELRKYVDDHLGIADFAIFEDMRCFKAPLYRCEEQDEMAEFVKNNKNPSFREMLFMYIDRLGISDSEVHKKAGIDRRHFSKIRSNPDYHPGKNTAIALSLALGLSRKEAEKLMGAAGYTLSDSETFDLVILFCLERKIHDINDVNLALDYFSLKPLAGVSG